MRVLVCGGRDYNDPAFVYWMLSTLHAKKPITLVIHGCANGADTFGQAWAEARSGEVTSYGVPADWKKHGSRAGPIRNRLMLELGKPDLVVAFEGGAGTRDMTSAATAAGVKVLFADKLKPHFDAAKPTAQPQPSKHKWTPKSTTPAGGYKSLCACAVLPWEDCEHTREK